MIDESERGDADADARVLSLELPWKKSAQELREPGAAPGQPYPYPCPYP